MRTEAGMIGWRGEKGRVYRREGHDGFGRSSKGQRAKIKRHHETWKELNGLVIGEGMPGLNGVIYVVGGVRVAKYAVIGLGLQGLYNGARTSKIHIGDPHWNDRRIGQVFVRHG